MAVTTENALSKQRAGWLARNVTCQLTRETDTTQYAAKDAISDDDTAPTVFKVSNLAAKNGGAGIIRGITLVKSTSTLTAASFNLELFTTTFTALEDNAIVDITDTEARTSIAVIPFTAVSGVAYSLNARWTNTNLDIPFVCASGDSALYLVFSAAEAYTPANAEVFDFKFLVECPAY